MPSYVLEPTPTATPVPDDPTTIFIDDGKGPDEGEETIPVPDTIPEYFSHQVWRSKEFNLPAEVFLVFTAVFAFSTIAIVMILRRTNKYILGTDGTDIHHQRPRAEWIVSPVLLFVCSVLAIRARNVVYLLAALAFQGFLTVSACVEAASRNGDSPTCYGITWATGHSASLRLVWAIPAVGLLCSLGCGWSIWRLSKDLGWFPCERILGSPQLIRLYNRRSVLSSLLVASTYLAMLQLWTPPCLFLIEEIKNDRRVGPAIFVVFWLFYAVGALFLVIGGRKESREILYFGSGMHLLYAIWIIVQCFKFRAAVAKTEIGSIYIPAGTILQIVVGWIVGLITFVCTYVVARGFDKGLKARPFHHPFVFLACLSFSLVSARPSR